ncbi:GPI ethanolamine phosphate transferase 2 [Anopheles ziemanni]|uniref:GPI ethanolamine phosphate transferase 2 n=1 Tax=Anopheles coustani TaxID=139045 RepID=UPI002659FDE2|nr:GPI ethanolamine phosphate transferase 2 [Anopheles coustani]XP_058166710.1 GPI ethanolamine phosphate transferase 2 [Anopheles ziemanni]
MNVKLAHIAVFNFLVFLFSFSLFCYGFFPLSFSPSTKSSLNELPRSVENASVDTNSYKPRISRAVFMLIDALRVDFIEQEANFKFLNKLVDDGKACLYRLKVHPPTVTMPRIKAMTSGAIPSFLDVILNLGSPEMKLDTFLYQMKQRQQKTVFYGDNTWTNMFPDMFHRQGENVDSLYVNDFYEGDQNITKFLNLELQMYDWKLMILHYLGLDHIGHVEGPFSDKVPGKLQEMDQVVETIYQTMHKWEKKYFTKPLLIITGDHGMRDSGGHGGSTQPETIVPLVVVSDQCRKSDEIFLQIDLAPTMSILTGVAIPHASIGSVIEPVLQGLDNEDKLYALYYNTQRLISKTELIMMDRLHATDMYKNFEEAKRLHVSFMKDTTNIASYKRALMLYSSAAKKLTEQLITSYIRYDLVFIVIGATLSISCTVMAFFQILQTPSTETISLHPKLFPAVCLCIITFVFLKILSFEKQLSVPNYALDAALVGLASILSTIWWLILVLLKGIEVQRLNLRNIPSYKTLALWFGIVFHCLSLGSSSFVEEEHQTWYYFTSSIMVLLTIQQLQIMNHTIGMINHPQTDAALIDVCRDERNQFCISSVAFLCVHVLIRRFNQTGDKWQHIPDVGDWLASDGNKVWLSLSMAVGLFFLVYQICCLGGLLTNVLSLTAALLIYYYRAVTGAVSFFGRNPPNSSVCLTIFWINLLEIFFIGFLPKMYRLVMGRRNPKRSTELYDNCLIIVALLSALLHKPHNVLLVGVLMASSRFLIQRIDRVIEHSDTNLMFKVIIHYWLGKAFYFYQGNSNSLATIDLNAGYVGLNHFDIVRVGIFLTLHTYSGPILSFLMLIHHLFNANQMPRVESDGLSSRRRILSLTNSLTMLPVSFFIIVATVLRDHIFVWTVFSPKLMYEYFHVWLVLIKIILVMCLLKTNGTN